MEGEAVIVLPEEGTVKVLNAVGPRIWDLVDGVHTVQKIAKTIYGEYDASLEQAEMELVESVTEMVQADLLTMEATVSTGCCA